MGTKLYVGNLSFNTTENELQELFSQAGTVQEVTLMQDKFTGKSRGFAFVTMGSEQEAQNAITQFNGKSVEGRSLTVNEARHLGRAPLVSTIHDGPQIAQVLSALRVTFVEQQGRRQFVGEMVHGGR